MQLSGLGQRPTTNDQRLLQLLLAASLLAIPLLLYRPVLQHDFLRLWDDDAYVTDNLHVRLGLTLTNVRWAFTSFEQSNWHPVAWLSHMLDCQLFAMDEAHEHYRASCVIRPRTEYCHYNIGHIFLGCGQFRDSIEEYDLALRYTANRDITLLCLTEEAEAQLQTRDYMEAQKSVAQALSIDPSNSAALHLQQIIRSKGGAN